MKITDKVKHFVACGVVSGLASGIEAGLGARLHMALIAGVMAGMAIGVGKEYGDSCAAGNRWSWGDIWADGAGAVVGAVAGTLLIGLIVVNFK